MAYEAGANSAVAVAVGNTYTKIFIYGFGFASKILALWVLSHFVNIILGKFSTYRDDADDGDGDWCKQ